MSELTIREIDQDEEFSEWLSDVLHDEARTTGSAFQSEDHHLVLSNEIGDWIGGLRYALRGGVAHLMELVVVTQERHRGHAHRLLAAFEEHAGLGGAHLVEFWTQDLRSEALMAAFGWRRVLERPQYIGGETWYLLEKELSPTVGDNTASDQMESWE
ncbi:MAG: GNAT family N-acetyltransferase [Gemmatimonadales bacterium]